MYALNIVFNKNAFDSPRDKILRRTNNQNTPISLLVYFHTFGKAKLFYRTLLSSKAKFSF